MERQPDTRVGPQRIAFITAGDRIGAIGVLLGFLWLGVLTARVSLHLLAVIAPVSVLASVLFVRIIRIRGQAAIYSDRIEVRNPDGETREVPFVDVAAVQLCQDSFPVAVVLELSSGMQVAIGPLMRPQELTTALSRHLEGETPFYKAPRQIWPRAYYAVGSGLGLVIGGVLLLVVGLQYAKGPDLSAFQSGILPYTLELSMLGLGLVALGLVWLVRAICWKPKGSETGLAEIPKTLANDFESPGTNQVRRYRYPAGWTHLRFERQIRMNFVALALLILALLIGAAFIARDSQFSPAFGAICFLLPFAILGLSVLIWVRLMRRLMPDLDSVIETQGTSTWLLDSAGRHQVDRMGEAIITAFGRDSTGLGTMTMVLEVAGKERWIDPSAMTRQPVDSQPAT